jgi:tetratricopeptide (TPR) repeat protein
MATWWIPTGAGGSAVDDAINGSRSPVCRPPEEAVPSASGGHGAARGKPRRAGIDGPRKWIAALVRLPAVVLTLCLEAPVSRRGMPMVFIGLGVLWVLSGWIRPPLNPDLWATHLPLAFLWGGGPAPLDLLHGPRHFVATSLGAALLALLAAGALVLLWRPRYLSAVAGMLLVATVIGNAAAALNHPALTELLVSENIQRAQMVEVLQKMKEKCLSLAGNGRVPYAGNQVGDPAAVLNGWTYLLYGVWLAAWCMAGILYGGRGSLRRRLGNLALWSVLAASAGAAACLPRLWGEIWWYRATRLELEADFPASRGAMQKAVSIFPEFAELGRTWALKGKLDFRQGLFTRERQFWAASQYALVQQSVVANAWMEELVADSGTQCVRQQAADLLAESGLGYFRRNEFGAAADAFIKVARAAPWRLDPPFYLCMIHEQWDHSHAQLIEYDLRPLLERCADRGFNSDLLGVLGDVYFESALVAEAHRQYDRSFRLFNLPKNINLRAQRGLGGM